MKKESLLNILINNFNIPEKEASALIMTGKVLVDEKPFTKAGIKIDPNLKIRIKDRKQFVSRGAYKLLTAFENIKIDIKDKICLDVGSSTGGFTEVLLEKGASKVYAVDCGENQLDFSLRNNPKVTVFENKKFQYLTKADIPDLITFAVMDVSFTSSVHLIEHIIKEFDVYEMVILIKPQFEYQRLKNILSLSDSFNGIVEKETDREKIVDYIKNEVIAKGLEVAGILESSIKGTKGNTEYLFYLKNNN